MLIRLEDYQSVNLQYMLIRLEDYQSINLQEERAGSVCYYKLAGRAGGQLRLV